jgi:hypothetical protein
VPSLFITIIEERLFVNLILALIVKRAKTLKTSIKGLIGRLSEKFNELSTESPEDSSK